MKSSIYLIMGVSGSGKTTIGKLLASQLNLPYYDADDFHPESNINKMSSGIPLTDEDRIPWLTEINSILQDSIRQNKSIVFACSALKQEYRNILSENVNQSMVYIYLKGTKEQIHKRITNRSGHFMASSLLDSQFDILEEPKNAITIDIKYNTQTILENLMDTLQKSSFGIIGLGVMGKSLARNFANKGVNLSLFNRNVPGKEEQIAIKSINDYPELNTAKGFEDLKLFVDSLQKPRKIFLMIKAGEETTQFIHEIMPLLSPDDILIDGGNSYFGDTKMHIDLLKTKQIHFIGTGVSGGELGALNGPSIMPSGDPEAYSDIEYYLNLIAAKDINGQPCCTYIGPEGSGHFVKMVHNGIEYAEMQLIAETYAYLRYVSKLNPEAISSIFKDWNTGELNSYLLEITSQLLLKKENESYLIDLILDVAGNKGTGNWTTISASELGIPSTMITSALFARYLSTIKEAVTSLQNKNFEVKVSSTISESLIKDSYKLARITNHQQGFLLLQTASNHYNWNLNLQEIARIWTNGCIIRSVFMEQVILLFQTQNDIFDDLSIKELITNLKPALKEFCVSAIQHDLTIPCHFSALDYLNTLRGNYATANIIQAQRDYFGAHTYQKIGDISGKYYHTQW